MTIRAGDQAPPRVVAPGSVGAPGPRAGILRLGLITCLSLEAALIHLWYLPESLMEWWGYGAFFLGCAVGQAMFGPVLMLRPTQLVIQAGIWANAGVVALYVFTRVWGVPLGPHTEMVEGVGLFDLMSVASEVGVIVLLSALLHERARRITFNGLMALGILLWALRFAVGAVLI